VATRRKGKRERERGREKTKSRIKRKLIYIINSNESISAS
jgi:hypothetical protein